MNIMNKSTFTKATCMLLMLFLCIAIPPVYAQKTNNMTPSQLTDLGNAYYAGKNGKKKDFAKAVECYRKAAEKGYARGQRNLGFMYENGEGVAKDFTEAVKWYKKAANQGFAQAQYDLGRMYEKGRGVKKNMTTANLWYQEAAKQGHEKAKKKMDDQHLISIVSGKTETTSTISSQGSYMADNPSTKQGLITVATKSNPGGVISVVTNKPSNDSSSSSTPTNNPPKNTSTSNTSSSSIADGIYVIKCSGDPNYVLTLKNNKVTANNELVVYQWQNTNYQKWKVENAGDGTITIKSMADNKYSIGVDPNGVFDHAQVVSLLCKNQKNERWVPQKNSKGYFFLKLLANKDFFLDVLDFNYFNNNIVQVCGYYGEHNQQFIFQKL